MKNPSDSSVPSNEYDIAGNWATLILPFNRDASIDYQRLTAEIDLLIQAGVNGIYSNGTAGEFYNITEEEFDQVNFHLSEKCTAANMPFQIGVSHMSPVLSLESLERAIKFQPNAVQLILPDWFVPTDDEVVTFLEKMAETAKGLKLVLYNPPHAKRRLSPKEFGYFKKKIPSLQGIKVVGGNTQWYKEMRMYCENLSVFIPGHFLATGIRNGAQGSYSNMACLNPSAAQNWYNLTQKNMDKALELESRVNLFLNEHIIPLITKEKYSNMAVDKFLVHLGGWLPGELSLRWPYRSVPEELAQTIRPAAQQIIPEFVTKMN